ncbi:hypothetical protein MMC30_008049 [Trapelia coarctata]|nr:hypothetical protein [Trapelia coarctata]
MRELKDLLDEKDEKIDILSRIHSFSSPRRSSTTSELSTAHAEEANLPPTPIKEDVFKVQQSPYLLDSDKKSDPFFMGASSGRAFVDAFKSKLQESGKSNSNFNTKAFFTPSATTPSSPKVSGNFTAKVPPRLLSDQMINVFFQEWAPLFPVLHRPTFLKLYADYAADPEALTDCHSLAQLHLVFGIAAISCESNALHIANFESQWRPALEAVISQATLATLQCLVLAQIFCITKGDHSNLLYYNGVAVKLSQRLGLHQSQKRFSLGALTRETRKKVFWSLYTLDCFSAAALGLPRLIRDDDIHTEYPADVDDENVTERGFQPALPGESTKLSSALALFRAARIMSKVLSEIYPADAFHETSLQKIGALGDELDTWNDELPPHLRLDFIQDKPSTNVISSRSPLLSLAYYYIRTLIHRSVIGSSLGAKASSSVVTLADSSKHIIKIVQLLEERRMNFTFCLNMNELLLLSGFGLLYQGLDLKQEGKLIRDNQRLVCSVIEILERNLAPGATAFKKLACSIIAVERFAKGASTAKTGATDTTNNHPRGSDANLSIPKTTSKSTKKQLQALASRFSFGANSSSGKTPQAPSGRRSTALAASAINLGVCNHHGSQVSLSSIQSEPASKRTNSDPRMVKPGFVEQPNLDYLPFSNEDTRPPSAHDDSKSPAPTSDWEHLLGFIETGNGFNCDGNVSNYPSPDLLSPYINTSPPNVTNDWSPDSWGLHDGFGQHPAPAQSVFSLSEESLTSGEEFSSCDYPTEYRGIAMPNLEVDFGLESSYGL